MAGRTKKWTAYDVPHLRDDLISSLDAARVNFATAIDMLQQAGSWEHVRSTMYHYNSVVRQHEHLREADLPMHYLSGSMCDLITEMSDDLPEWTASAAMPGDSGFLIFERPMTEVLYATPKYQTPTPIRGLFWFTNADDGVEIVALTGRDNEKVIADADGDLIFKVGLVNFHRSALQGGGREITDVRRNDSIVDIGEFDSDSQYAKINALLGATWLLMGQERVTEYVDTPVRTKGRTSEGRKYARDVVVRERSLTKKSPSSRYIEHQAQRRQQTGESSRNYTRQWWVRGHWRQQACGPKWQERRPVYIEPHIAGPEDVEPDRRPEVTRWRR